MIRLAPHQGGKEISLMAGWVTLKSAFAETAIGNAIPNSYVLSMSWAILAASAISCSSAEADNGYTFRCGNERIRIASIVAPELPDALECKDHRRAYAWCDYRAGYRARDALQTFLNSGPVTVRRVGFDRYKRILARVTVNGVDVGEHMVRIGVAKHWR